MLACAEDWNAEVARGGSAGRDAMFPGEAVGGNDNAGQRQSGPKHTPQAQADCANEAPGPARSAARRGPCQTAGDRCDSDPQLAALNWLTEITGTKIGRWPVAEVPVKLSESPAYAGGRIDRGAPCYGEDNEYVYGELLGMATQEIAKLAEDGII